MTQALLLSDTHLSPLSGAETGRALARLLAENPDADLILAGDVFDLSLDAAERPPAEGASAALAAYPELVRALSGHVGRGRRVLVVPGNHDASLAEAAAASALFSALAPPDDRQLTVLPWFGRLGAVHVEHGHLYDADCAPDHPLAKPDPHSEGLGTALMRRFVAPNDALCFAHAHDTTPASGLRTAFERWGARAPVLVARYFATAFALCAEAALAGGARRAARRDGELQLSAHAERTALRAEQLVALLEQAPRPTHDSLGATFQRLYFDRILASSGCVAGAAALVTGLSPWASGAPLLPAPTAAGALAFTLGASYLGQSLARSRSRYAEGPGQALAAAAAHVRAVTSARLVVFGHTHQEEEQPGYVNLGSFAFGKEARPYLLVDEQGRYERRYLAR